jgi:hypothetical protein
MGVRTASTITASRVSIYVPPPARTDMIVSYRDLCAVQMVV